MIVIIGAGGFGREVLMSINDQNYDVLGFIDDSKKGTINGLKVIGGIDSIKPNMWCVNTISDSILREKINKKLGNYFPVITHPSCKISDTSEILDGTIIQFNTLITTDTIIKNHVHINFNCTIAHDCVIDDYVTIAPGVHINGNVKVGKHTYIGSGATTKQGINIGKNCVIAAGSMIIHDVPDNTMVAGVPAVIKKRIPKVSEGQKVL